MGLSKITLIAGLALALFGFFLPGCSDSEQSTKPKLGNFYLSNTEGKVISLSEYGGRVVMLNFWATWCPPCRQEIPDFIELQEELGAEGLTIVGISLDQASVEDVHRFKREANINYPVLYAGDQAEKLVDSLGGFQGVPTTFLIDRQGNIVGKFTGVAPKEAWANEVKKLL